VSQADSPNGAVRTYDALARVFEHAQVGLLLTDADNTIVDCNGALCRISGFRRDELLGLRPSMFKSGQHDEGFYDRMWSELLARDFWNGTLCNRRRDGSLYQASLSLRVLRDAEGRITHHVGLISDVAPLAVGDGAPARHGVIHFDVLTGLPNRFLLGDRIEQAVARNKRAGSLLAVCFIDLDGFKLVNDNFGHDAGDLLLKEVASRLLRTLRASDTVARLGGDEFVVLLSGLAGENECCQTLDRLLAAIAEPYALPDRRHAEISASIGVTLYPADDGDADLLLHHADQAMYAAKQAGRNRYQLFDARMEQRIQARNDTLRRLDRSLRADQFELHYQPTVDVRRGRVISLEALLRWRHPVLGMLGPGEFIPLIEDDELALGIGTWVFRAALTQARAWHAQGIETPLSINTFPRQLVRSDFSAQLGDLVHEIWPDMPAGRLQLEILESSRPHSAEPIRRNLQTCRSFGIRVSLDDFGSGTSSLSGLRQMALDEVKIYQAFVRELPGSLPMIKGIIALGRAFGIRVVAEGVETREQVEQLLELGCDAMQGYAIARPMPADAVAGWLADFGRGPGPEPGA